MESLEKKEEKPYHLYFLSFMPIITHLYALFRVRFVLMDLAALWNLFSPRQHVCVTSTSAAIGGVQDLLLLPRPHSGITLPSTPGLQSLSLWKDTYC